MGVKPDASYLPDECPRPLDNMILLFIFVQIVVKRNIDIDTYNRRKEKLLINKYFIYLLAKNVVFSLLI